MTCTACDSGTTRLGEVNLNSAEEIKFKLEVFDNENINDTVKCTEIYWRALQG